MGPSCLVSSGELCYGRCLQQKWIPVLRENAPSVKERAYSSFLPAPETSFFMPRDDDKNNNSRGRRDRPSGGKGRSGVPRGPEKKFAKRGFGAKDGGGKNDGER